MIEKLTVADGSETSDEAQMHGLATEYFKNLYTSDGSVQPDLITSLLQEKVTQEANDTLCSAFTDDEISFALFQIGPTKAPGPDGFPACFLPKKLGYTKRRYYCSREEFFY
jgi:hypothetical protein